RLASTLADLITSCGTERDASVSRELSKLYEETRRGSLEQLYEHYRSGEVKGEVVVVVGPAEEPSGPAPNSGTAAALGADFAQVAARLASSGVRGRLLRGALEALGAPRNLAYRLAHTAADSAETGDGAATDHGEDE